MRKALSFTVTTLVIGALVVLCYAFAVVLHGLVGA